ncbi:unnamed protein product [Boreogadus saida]
MNKQYEEEAAGSGLVWGAGAPESRLGGSSQSELVAWGPTNLGARGLTESGLGDPSVRPGGLGSGDLGPRPTESGVGLGLYVAAGGEDER